MYEVAFTRSFRKSVKRLFRLEGGKTTKEKVEVVVETIRQGRTLGPKYKDHALRGIFEGYRECHIKPDVLLLYEVDKELLLVTLINIGSHSELFGS